MAPLPRGGARRGLLVGEATDPDGPEAPGLVVLREDWSVESLTPGVERWLAELPDSDWLNRGTLPPVVLAVAGRALRTAEGTEAPGEIALARVLSQAGRWVVLHGASLVADGTRRVAVIIEPAQPARIASLLMAAYGLTEREQDVTRLVLQGNSTAEIAARLRVSAQTVQQHLKSVFDKTGVQEPARPRRQGVLRPLRAAPARQRAARDCGPTASRRTAGPRRRLRGCGALQQRERESGEDLGDGQNGSVVAR